MPKLTAPPMPAPWYEHKTICSVCRNKRSSGNHEDCSKIRQAEFAAENKAGKP